MKYQVREVWTYVYEFEIEAEGIEDALEKVWDIDNKPIKYSEREEIDLREVSL